MFSMTAFNCQNKIVMTTIEDRKARVISEYLMISDLIHHSAPTGMTGTQLTAVFHELFKFKSNQQIK